MTANVDFLVQARHDVELHRILLNAHLVLCDGTPLCFGFLRLLGNPLPERVAGADLAPLLILVGSAKGLPSLHSVGRPEVSTKAVANLRAQFPDLIIAGHYSPPFQPLLDMDHDMISPAHSRSIRARKFARERGTHIVFTNVQANVRNVLRLSKMEAVLLETGVKIGIPPRSSNAAKQESLQHVFALIRAFITAGSPHQFVLFVLEEDLPLFQFAASAMQLVTLNLFRPPEKNIFWHQFPFPSFSAATWYCRAACSRAIAVCSGLALRAGRHHSRSGSIPSGPQV